MQLDLGSAGPRTRQIGRVAVKGSVILQDFVLRSAHGRLEELGEHCSYSTPGCLESRNTHSMPAMLSWNSPRAQVGTWHSRIVSRRTPLSVDYVVF